MSLPRGVTRSIPGFDPDGLGANPSEAASVGKSSFDRLVVK